VLAPGRPERAVQLIDARDLAEWLVRLAEEQRSGIFNAIGPGATLTMAQLLESCRAPGGGAVRFTWVPDDELVAADVKPWTELPLWIPERDPDYGGMMLAQNWRAMAAGLTFRPLADTAAATLAWDRLEGDAAIDSPIRVTPLAPDREADVLARRAAVE
jgi:2'-hydroxyisoflavone reductase